MNDRASLLQSLLAERILVLDGAMGTMIQKERLSEEQFRGERFRGWGRDLRGNNDLLTLTQPALVRRLHLDYLEAGVDIIETNTFNSTSVSLGDYGMEELAYEINLAAARLARDAADEWQKRDRSRPRFVAGAIGPTTKTASISPDVNDPGFRNISFDALVAAYGDALRGLIDGGVDLILVETVFDTLNAKAALFAIESEFGKRGTRLPLIISGTITDASGRTLSGQTTEAFYNSVRHANPIAVGLNCALGAKELRQYVEELSGIAEMPVSCYPNAGLPNAFGEYDDTPESMAKEMGSWARSGFLNFAGGCCGTAPEHIRAIAEAVRGVKPRRPPKLAPKLRLSGLEPLNVGEGSLFVNVGERTNVTGSKAFSRLVLAGNYAEALSVARQQVESGAQVIDVNMDEGMLDSEKAMVTFLNLAASEPDISRVPVMVDSSKWSVIEAGLRCLQGKGIVNSISMKEGEAEFLRQASLVRRYGAAVVVMAFDEQGQADTLERRIAVCRRAYDLLIKKAGFEPEDIIFDPNIFAVATGLEEHARYGLDFIEAVKWIRANLPGVGVSGGVSNLSFSFRGNDAVREAMHTAFLYHAVKAGMTMGIVNAGQLGVYEKIEPGLRERVEDVILARRADATERLRLITPSLEEMAHVAREMEREGFTVPLLIGGATTSRTHTAVKIAPNYPGPVVYVPDASRSVGVMQSVLSPEQSGAYVAGVRADYEKIRSQHRDKKGPGPLLPIAEARRLGLAIDWSAYRPPAPRTPGIAELRDYSIEKLVPYIDWTPFFQAWELSGPYPKILDDPVVGEAARKVHGEAQDMLRKIVDEKWVSANGIFGLFPAARVNGDDIEIYSDATRRAVAMTWHNLRQQNQKPAGRANQCLADFVAPKDSGVPDWIGAFAVAVGGLEPKLAQFEAQHDDYSAIMLKVLADRLAEAFAEHLHERVRREFWGYAPDEKLSSEQLIAEAYRGIRPAPGYPACPDHTEKRALFDLLQAERNAGITLTESFAMLPASAVSGFYLSHPQSGYFAVGKIGRDQVEEYATRKAMPVEEAERWLAPYLAYEPADIMAGTST